MKIAIGSDHAGFGHKEKVKGILKGLGYEVLDFGTSSKESVDYPDFGLKVAHAVVNGDVTYGIAICWTGNGMMIATNKVKGIRAGMALNREMAYYTRLHNNANVLVLSGKYTPEGQLEEIVKTFLTTDFEGGRHIRRLQKIEAEENSQENK